MTAQIKARPTQYRGIPMRSRLEADYAAELDKLGYRWAYEPECFASAAGQWLPDFGCTWADEGPLAILDEVKPAEPLKKHLQGSGAFTAHVDALLERMTIAWASRPSAYLRLVFWQYGGPAYLVLHCRRAGDVWYAEFTDQPTWLLWPGMGQHERCKTSGRAEAS